MKKVTVALVLIGVAKSERYYRVLDRNGKILMYLKGPDHGHGASVVREFVARRYNISSADWASKLQSANWSKDDSFSPTEQDIYLGLTKAQFERFHSACHAVWDTVASDMFAALRDSEEGSRDTMPRSDVIECVLDGGCFDMYGERFRRVKNEMPWPVFYKTILDPWIGQHYDTPAFNALMKQVFPFETYGV